MKQDISSVQAKLPTLNPAAEVSDPYAFKLDKSVDESKTLELEQDEKTEEGKSQEDQQKMVGAAPGRRKPLQPVQDGAQADTKKVDQQRYRDFMRLLHKCSDENERAQSMNIELLRSFCAKLEVKNPFSDKEIDDCIDYMAKENKVMRSGDIVFMI